MNGADHNKRTFKEQERRFEDERKALKREIHDLKKELKNKEEIIEKEEHKKTALESENESRILEIEELKAEITKLKQDIKSLQDKLKDLELLKQKLQLSTEAEYKVYLSQAASLFEQAVCSYVLPKMFKGDIHATIKKLLKVLNVEQGDMKLPPELVSDMDKTAIEEMKRKARENFDKLCNDLVFPAEWKREQPKSEPIVLRAINLLKDDRNTIAHPKPISMTTAEEMVQSNVIKHSGMPEWQFELIKKFIASLRKIMIRSGLSHEQLELD